MNQQETVTPDEIKLANKIASEAGVKLRPHGPGLTEVDVAKILKFVKKDCRAEQEE